MVWQRHMRPNKWAVHADTNPTRVCSRTIHATRQNSRLPALVVRLIVTSLQI